MSMGCLVVASQLIFLNSFIKARVVIFLLSGFRCEQVSVLRFQVSATNERLLEAGWASGRD